MEKLSKTDRVLFRTLYRWYVVSIAVAWQAGQFLSLLDNARIFDKFPALKALIVRYPGGRALPQPLDGYLADMMGQKESVFFWPHLAKLSSIREIVKYGFRQTWAEEGRSEIGFQGVRYLSSLLFVARKHSMVGTTTGAMKDMFPMSSSMTIQGRGNDPFPDDNHLPSVELLKHVEKGSMLVSHPCLPGWFSRTTVLMVQELTPAQGAKHNGWYGIALNKTLGGSHGGTIYDLMKAQGKSGGSHIIGQGVMEQQQVKVSPVTNRNSIDSNKASELEKNSFLNDLLGRINRNDVEAKDSKLKFFGDSTGGHPPSNASAKQKPGPRWSQSKTLVSVLQEHLGAKVTDLSPFSRDKNSSNETKEEILSEKENLTTNDKSFSRDSKITSEEHGSDDTLSAGFEAIVDSLSDEEIVEAAQLGFHIAESLSPEQREEIAEVLQTALLGHEENQETRTSQMLELHGKLKNLLENSLSRLNAAETYSKTTEKFRDIISSSSPESKNLNASPDDKSSSTSYSSGTEGLRDQEIMGLLPDSRVLLGGPVPGVTILHRLPHLGGEEVLPPSDGANNGVFLGSTVTISEAADFFSKNKDKRYTKESVNLIIGDSRWEPGQIESELKQGAWIVLKSSDIPSLVRLFQSKSKTIPSSEEQLKVWKRALKSSKCKDLYAFASVPTKVWRDLQDLEI